MKKGQKCNSISENEAVSQSVEAAKREEAIQKLMDTVQKLPLIENISTKKELEEWLKEDPI